MAGRLPGVLSILLRFAEANADEPDEVRAYVRENADTLAEHLAFKNGIHPSAGEIRYWIDGIEHDKLIETVKSTVACSAAVGRMNRSLDRVQNAQASADALSHCTEWAMSEWRPGIKSTAVYFDAISVLASCLTTGAAHFIVVAEFASNAWPMSTLIAIRNELLDTSRATSLRGWIEYRPEGAILNLRWRNALGRESGFRLRPAITFDLHAEDVSFNVSRASIAQAAE